MTDHRSLPDPRRYRWNELVARANDSTTLDTDGVRDPEAPCESFRQGLPGTGTCDTDGHYLCAECSEISLLEVRRRGDCCEECGTPLVRTTRGPTCDHCEPPP